MARTIAIISAIVISTSAAYAQTFPANYPAISGTNSPPSGATILPTDFIGVNRVVGGAYTYVGLLPLSDFASSNDIANTNAAVAATNSALSATNSALHNSNSGIAAALGGGAAVNTAGQMTAPNYVIQGNNYNNVGLAFSEVNAALNSIRTEARAGVANAMAMSTASMPSAPGRTSWTVNLADYYGESAVGASFAHRLDMRVPLAITAGFAITRSEAGGGRVGLAGEF